MRQLKPYKTVPGARRALDNGGRFYNLWAQAGDDTLHHAGGADHHQNQEHDGIVSPGKTASAYGIPSCDRPSITDSKSRNVWARLSSDDVFCPLLWNAERFSLSQEASCSFAAWYPTSMMGS